MLSHRVAVDLLILFSETTKNNYYDSNNVMNINIIITRRQRLYLHNM